jgi:hypothetical protein
MDGQTDRKRDNWIHTHTHKPISHPSICIYTSLSLCIYLPFRIYHRLSVCICLYIHPCMLPNNYLRSLHYHTAQTIATVSCYTVFTYSTAVTMPTLSSSALHTAQSSPSLFTATTASMQHTTPALYHISQCIPPASNLSLVERTAIRDLTICTTPRLRHCQKLAVTRQTCTVLTAPITLHFHFFISILIHYPLKHCPLHSVHLTP